MLPLVAFRMGKILAQEILGKTLFAEDRKNLKSWKARF